MRSVRESEVPRASKKSYRFSASSNTARLMPIIEQILRQRQENSRPYHRLYYSITLFTEVCQHISQPFRVLPDSVLIVQHNYGNNLIKMWEIMVSKTFYYFYYKVTYSKDLQYLQKCKVKTQSSPEIYLNRSCFHFFNFIYLKSFHFCANELLHF